MKLDLCPFYTKQKKWLLKRQEKSWEGDCIENDGLNMQLILIDCDGLRQLTVVFLMAALTL